MLVFVCIMIANAVALVSGQLELDVLHRIQDSTGYILEEAEASDVRQILVGLFQFSCYLASMILFVMWFRRSYWNAHALRPHKLKHDEGWASYGFMVPFLNLYYPAQIASEIDDSTTTFLKEHDSEVSQSSYISLISAWWIFYLIHRIYGYIVFRVTLSYQDNVSELIIANRANFWADAIDIVGAAITLLMIYKFSKKEAKLYQTVTRMNNNTALASE